MISYENINLIKWLYISIANEAGYDKENWSNRIIKGKELLTDYINGSYDPTNVLEHKRLQEAVDLINGDKTDYPTIYLDATASGLQILSAISLDTNSGKKVNIGTNTRRDVYVDTSNEFTDMFGLDNITRDDIKKPLMTYFYNSNAKIKELLGNEVADLFFDYLNDEFTGPVKIMNILRKCWTDNKYHAWKLPDMICYVPVEVSVTEPIKYNDTELPYTYYVNQGDLDQWRTLAPNIVHSLDAWILRYVVNRFKENNKPISVIHDSFQVSITDAGFLIDCYKEAFVTMIEDELLIQILKDLGLKVNPYEQIRKEKIIETIKESEYMLS